jgi:hypothetical protein
MTRVKRGRDDTLTVYAHRRNDEKILPSQRIVTLCVGFRVGLLFAETLLFFGQETVNLFNECH